MTEKNKKILSLRRRFDRCEAKLGTVPVTESIAKVEKIFREANKLDEELGLRLGMDAFSGVDSESPGEAAGDAELQKLPEDCNELLVKLHYDSRN